MVRQHPSKHKQTDSFQHSYELPPPPPPSDLFQGCLRSHRCEKDRAATHEYKEGLAARGLKPGMEVGNFLQGLDAIDPMKHGSRHSGIGVQAASHSLSRDFQFYKS